MSQPSPCSPPSAPLQGPVGVLMVIRGVNGCLTHSISQVVSSQHFRPIRDTEWTRARDSLIIAMLAGFDRVSRPQSARSLGLNACIRYDSPKPFLRRVRRCPFIFEYLFSNVSLHSYFLPPPLFMLHCFTVSFTSYANKMYFTGKTTFCIIFSFLHAFSVVFPLFISNKTFN